MPHHTHAAPSVSRNQAKKKQQGASSKQPKARRKGIDHGKSVSDMKRLNVIKMTDDLNEATHARLMAPVLPEIEELAQAIKAAPALQEVMAHQLRRAGPGLDVHTKTDGQERFELFGQLVWLL